MHFQVTNIQHIKNEREKKNAHKNRQFEIK